MSGLASTVAQGFAFGTGSAIAHRAVGAVADGMSGGEEESQPQEQQQYSGGYAGDQQQQQGPCGRPQQQLYSCLQEQDGSAVACQFYFDALRQCQEDMKYASASQ